MPSSKVSASLLSFTLLIPLYIAGVFFLNLYEKSLPIWINPFVQGFGGNIVSGIFTGILFVPLSIYLGGKVEQLITSIHSATEQRERLLESERIQRGFERFMNEESYHDIRFPNLRPNSDSLGLEYTISPVRDPQTGKPLKHETEMEELFVVKIEGPAHISVMTDEQKAEYDDSPIRDGEYAFCQFYNDSWHLGHSTPHVKHAFYLSGKVGQVQIGQSANSFVSRGFADAFVGKEKIASFLLQPDGSHLPANPHGVGCDRYEIFKGDDGSIFLRINESLPKPIVYTSPRNSFSDSDWILVIDDVRGYAHGEKLAKVIAEVEKNLAKVKIEPKRIPWYERPDFLH